MVLELEIVLVIVVIMWVILLVVVVRKARVVGHKQARGRSYLL